MESGIGILGETLLLGIGIRYWNLVWESLESCIGDYFPSLNKEFAEYCSGYGVAHPLARTQPPRPTHEETLAAYDDICLSECISAVGTITINMSDASPSKKPRMSLSEFTAEVNPLPPCAPEERAPEEGQVRKKAKFHDQVVKARFQTQVVVPGKAGLESRWWFLDPEESQVASPASPMQEEGQEVKSSETSEEESCWGPSSSTSAPGRSKPYES